MSLSHLSEYWECEKKTIFPSNHGGESKVSIYKHNFIILGTLSGPSSTLVRIASTFPDKKWTESMRESWRKFG